MDRTPISDLGGALAVGSIGFAGAFLIVDGINGLFLLIEEYAQTNTWAVLFAAPTLVLAYAFGVIAMQVTGAVRTAYDVRHGRDPLASFVVVARLNNAHMVDRYREIRRSQEFLQGVSPTAQLSFADIKLLANEPIRHTLFTGPPQSLSLELRAVAFIWFSLRHKTPPGALLRLF